jgi:hypothetical protein
MAMPQMRYLKLDDCPAKSENRIKTNEVVERTTEMIEV